MCFRTLHKSLFVTKFYSCPHFHDPKSKKPNYQVNFYLYLVVTKISLSFRKLCQDKNIVILRYRLHKVGKRIFVDWLVYDIRLVIWWWSGLVLLTQPICLIFRFLSVRKSSSPTTYGEYRSERFAIYTLSKRFRTSELFDEYWNYRRLELATKVIMNIVLSMRTY